VDKSDFFIRNVPIEDIAAAKSISDTIATTAELKRVVLTKNGKANKDDKEDISGHVLKDDVVEELVNNGLTKAKIRVLGLTKNVLESARSCSALASLLSRSDNTIEKFYLYRNLFKPTEQECIQQLTKLFIVDTHEGNITNKLHKLVFIDNDLGDEGLENVLKWIESPALNITDLILRNVGITENGAKRLAQSLSSPRNNIRKLDISENPKIGLEGLKTLVASISANQNLVHLELAHNEITSADAVKEIGELIQKSKSLQKIDISDNHFKDEGAQILVNILSQNPSLSKLDISGANLTDAVITLVAETVEKNNTNLSRLNLYRQEIVGENLQKRIIKLDKVIKCDYFEHIIDEDEDEDDDDDDEDEDEEDEDDEAEDEDDEDEDEEDEEEEEEEEEPATDEVLKGHDFFKKDDSKKHDEL
jgi:Ran GTPase-activating protein (RanGAP) involved in mRNA processing and transport